MKILANSSLSCHYIDEVLNLAKLSPDRAVEWDMNYIPPTLSKARCEYIQSFIENNNILLRYHLPYSYLEVAHIDHDIRNYSIITLKKYLDYIHKLNGHCAVLHIGYNECTESQLALQSLIEIAKYAENIGIRICVENLINGLTTDINFLNQALQINNVFLCLDTGHAHVVSQNNDDYCYDLLKLLDKCVHAHVYFTEDCKYNHIAFSDMSSINGSYIINALFSSKCDWYTMELDDKLEQDKQMLMFKSYTE